jgi:myo-inositol-1(or 4)-monophosphatase
MEIDIQKLINAALAGGKILKKYFGETLDTVEKHDASDYQTKADLESEVAILENIKKDFPDFNIHSEEEGITDKKSEYTVVIDPLDGTNNFVLGIPQVSVSIAVIRNKQVVAGVVHAPIIDQTYYAELGKGAYLEGKKISVSTVSSIERTTIAYLQGYETGNLAEGKMLSSLHKVDFKRVVTLWSPALDYCLLAQGKIDAIINNQCEIYDYAAGKLIAKEAGAKITMFDGSDEVDDTNSKFVASNSTEIHEKIIKLIS